MIRSYIACVAAVSALAVMPAAAADLPSYVEAPTVSPYYVVNQGPELSGPGITIVEIGLTNTDLKRSYPFIGTSDDLTRVVTPTGEQYLVPAALNPALKVRPRARWRSALHARSRVSWRKPLTLHRVR